ncbi:hypothetical protein F5Y10DRAFT_246763 [Nemania abortiva]|nr:hypothetical protein F5Y10DRAFT_246763 [Nemania abortiva]
MAIARKGMSHYRRERKRTTWTRFRLPLGQDWPKWPGYSDTYHGPLADVAGCERIRLGRIVEDPEQAALIVLWESAEALNDFQKSSLCGEFLRFLGCENEPLLSLQYDCGFCMGELPREPDDLYGRMTLTIVNVSITGVLDRDRMRGTLRRAFGAYMPEGCEDLRTPPYYHWNAYAWVDDSQQEQPTAVNASSSLATCYVFFRWNGAGASAEREEASVKEPGAAESWAQTIAEAMPPIETWKQERWDIEVAPCCLESDIKVEDEDEDEQ